MPDRLDPTFVLREIAALRATWPVDEDDDLAWLLSLESETDLPEFLATVVNIMLETGARIEGIGDLISGLKARCDRLGRRSEAMRGLMFKVMQAASVRKIELPAATLSIRAGQPRVIVTDEARLPPDCVRVRTEPDKITIKDRLTRGEPVPGASLSNSEPVLAVRVK